MVAGIAGIHHITAIAGNPQRNLDFYTKVLALRLVKLTVNFDDPGSYHFYFGDSAGNPGTILTFSPWQFATGGRLGSGEARIISFRVSNNSLPHWRERLAANSVDFEQRVGSFGNEELVFHDPDGLALTLTSIESNIEIPLLAEIGQTEYSISGFESLSLEVEKADDTIRLLTDIFGARVAANVGGATRVHLANAPYGLGATIDIIETGKMAQARLGAGSIHHVAFRCSNDAEQLVWQEKLMSAGYGVTEVRDRCYFRSIYFREPGGILFEIATDVPGFAIDEAPAKLGSSLQLPPWYEKSRSQIESRLPKLDLPKIL